MTAGKRDGAAHVDPPHDLQKWWSVIAALLDLPLARAHEERVNAKQPRRRRPPGERKARKRKGKR